MKKLTRFMVALYLLFCFVTPAIAAPAAIPTNFAESIAALESVVYGQEKSGPYVDRINALETIVYGKVSTMPAPDKIARMNKAFFDNSEQASIPLILRYAESQLLDKVGSGPVIGRLNKLEETLTGHTETGGIYTRLENVLKTLFASGTVKVNDTAIPGKTLVRIRLLDALNSDKNKAGDTFRYEVIESIHVENVLAIPAGSLGIGKVEKAKAAGHFGKHGKLDLSFDAVPAIDNTMVSVYLGERAREENKHVVAAAGASVFGAIILGPIGLIGGAFIEGKTVQLPVGTEFFVEVNNDHMIKGASLENAPAAPVQTPTGVESPVAEIRITK
jgi:hypothetical protein